MCTQFSFQSTSGTSSSVVGDGAGGLLGILVVGLVGIGVGDGVGFKIGCSVVGLGDGPGVGLGVSHGLGLKAGL